MDDFITLNQKFEQASPYEVLQWAVTTYGHKLALVTSFQPTGIVLLHMLRDLAPDLTVLTLDTGLLFPETYALIDQVEARFGIKVVRVRPAQTVEQQAQSHGDALWQRDPDQCCALRKTAPLNAALQGYAAWITGLRRDQSSARAATPIIEWDSARHMVKLSPLATWTDDMVWAWIHSHNLPYNPLHEQGYPSIGCAPCTHPVGQGEDKRAGRWRGRDKIECGIHQAPQTPKAS